MKLYIRKGEDAEGIDIKKWAWDHEAYIDAHIDTEDPEELLSWHLEKTRFLQHERLVHFIVTFLTVLGVFFAAGMLLLLPETTPFFLMVLLSIMLIGLLILLACYMYHYFVLENTVQHWYRIAERIHDRILARQAAGEGPQAGQPSGK